MRPSYDRVTVIFSTIFKDETDRIFGKVFLQEFVDARRRAIQNAPRCCTRKRSRRWRSETLSSPLLTPTTWDTSPLCFSPTSCGLSTRELYLAHPNLPRLLPLPYQVFQGLYALANAIPSERVPQGAEPSKAGECGQGEEDRQWKNLQASQLGGQ